MRKSQLLDLVPVDAALHVARDLLLAQADKTRGPHRRRLEAIKESVSDAIGSLARQGMDGRRMASRR